MHPIVKCKELKKNSIWAGSHPVVYWFIPGASYVLVMVRIGQPPWVTMQHCNDVSICASKKPSSYCITNELSELKTIMVELTKMREKHGSTKYAVTQKIVKHSMLSNSE